jgi:hypothetical protein
MKRHFATDPTPDANPPMLGEPPPDAAVGELPNRLLTAFDVAKFVGWHEETGRLRIPARVAHLNTLRRQRPPLSPARRPRLDPSRRTHQSLVARKEQTT